MMRVTVVILCLVGAAGLLPAANILSNSSFEDWLFGMPVGWITSELLYPGSAVQDSVSHTGIYSVKLTGTDTAAFVSTVAAVAPGRSYLFSGYALVPGALGGSFVLQFLDAQGDTLGLPQLLPVYNSTEFREYTTWVTAPDSADGIVVAFATLAGLAANVDDMTLDDTVTGGVTELPVYARADRFRVRKVVSVGSPSTTEPSMKLYDALGRAVTRPRSGVYFVTRGR